ncbi:MAG: hypothetical protein HKN47_28590 [Pirellulaceae bacterium]|nr:hypothetical protein [Pirellulaceae bacterium]
MSLSTVRTTTWIATFCLFTSVASAQTNKQRGATLGGLAGAVAGGLIGDHNDEAGAGAAIGGVIGAVAGGILGDANDKDAAIRSQQRYYQQQQLQYQQQQQRAVIMQSAVSLNDVVSMSRSGVGESIIINQIQQRGYGQQLQVADIIALHQQGVSQNVITALQRAPSPAQATAPAPIRTPVVVEQPVIVEHPIIHHRVVPAPVIVTPSHYGSPYRHHDHRYHHRTTRSPRSDFHFRF